jgi:hypothetical protein
MNCVLDTVDLDDAMSGQHHHTFLAIVTVHGHGGAGSDNGDAVDEAGRADLARDQRNGLHAAAA